MARSIPATVEPAVLRWARETIGLTEVAASRKIGRIPDDRVEQWEAGEARPTIAQLRRAAEVYRRSLGVFFLAEPPADFDTLRDFRRLQGTTAGVWSPALHADFRRAHEQHDAAVELAELDEVPPPTAWRLDPLPSRDVALAAAARELLLDVGPLDLPRSGDRPYEHLNAWVAALEAAGVLVLATAGGRVPVAEARAFSLYFDTYPVIVVNGADAPRGRLFSLIHEYAHLLLHTEGLCDMVTDRQAVSENRQLEARCNAIAADVLMPRALVLSAPVVQARMRSGDAWDYDALREAAGPFGVSAEAFLRRLATLGVVTDAFYSTRREEFQAAYDADAARETATGGNWYRNTARDLGKGYVRLVADAHRRRVIDSYTAATYLRIKTGQIDRLAATAALRSAV